MGIFSVFALTGLVLSQGVLAPQKDSQQAQVLSAIEEIDPYKDLFIEGKAAFVYDALTEEVLYEKNAHAQLPLASLTKIMTALLATETLGQDTLVRISAESLLPEGDSGFLPGDTWRMRDLRDFMLMTSSNDAAAALAEAIEHEVLRDSSTLMTERAQALGLSQTYFLNPTGLDEHEEFFSGSYGSARDMGILLAYIMRHNPSALEATTAADRVFADTAGTEFSAVNTNTVTGYIPGLSASKTGFTDLAGGNLAIAFEPEPGRTYVVVVLGSSKEGRFEDVVSLVRAALE